jgi:hypothetical protein
MLSASPQPNSDRPARFWVVWGAALAAILIGEGFRWSNPDARAFALTERLCGPEADWLPYLPAMVLGLVAVGIRGRREQRLRGQGLGPRARGEEGAQPSGEPSETVATLTPNPSPGGRGEPAGSAGHSPSAISYRPTNDQGLGTKDVSNPQPLPSTAITLLIGILGFAVAAVTGWSQKDLPPAYHDEYSYLFQTHTLLAGRTWFPSFEGLPQIFDQMHVLNEGRFASRYFPGAGMWFMAFHAVGPIWGQWFAQAVTAIGASLVATQIAGRRAGLWAGLAVAICPGLVLFSQLYLAHHPTLVGLTLFLVTFLRLKWHCEHGNIIRRKDRVGVLTLSFAAGLGLSYAMLCRPMTAAGVGLPFGVWLFWWAGRRPRGEGLGPRARGGPEADSGHPPSAIRHLPANDQEPGTQDTLHLPRPIPILLAMAIPIVAGIGLQLIYNKSITGRALTSPYQLYTDIYTPRHVYGFHNVTRGEQHLGPKVLDRYDRWAENLTLTLALKKMGIRLVASGRWTVGLVPLICLVAMLICRWKTWNSDLKLIVASIASLHVAHLPYWFEGIMGWHYVFESAPLWGIVLGAVTADFARWAREAGFPALRWWWGAMLLTSLGVSWVSVPALWTGRIERGLGEVAFSRMRYERFDQMILDQVTAPAIVFIRHNPDEEHIDYVNNLPQLEGPILKARAPEKEFDLRRAAGMFPDREAWLFDVASGKLRKLSGAE